MKTTMRQANSESKTFPELVLLIILMSLPILLTACLDKEIKPAPFADLSLFGPIAKWYPFDEISPSFEIDYWELIEEWDDEESLEVVYSDGLRCVNALNPLSCTEFLDEPRVDRVGGFHHCVDGSCWHFIRFTGKDSMGIVGKANLLGFLGEIDSKGDALLWVYANSYFFGFNDKSTGAYRQTENGHEVIAKKLVSDCWPIQVDRFLLSVAKDGEINILNRRVHSVDSLFCY